MLVLSRKCRERIYIGDALTQIVVIAIDGERVRLGVDAPADVPVHRGEVYAAILRNGGRVGTRQPELAAGLPSVVDTDARSMLLEFPDHASLVSALDHGRVAFRRPS